MHPPVQKLPKLLPGCTQGRILLYSPMLIPSIRSWLGSEAGYRVRQPLARAQGSGSCFPVSTMRAGGSCLSHPTKRKPVSAGNTHPRSHPTLPLAVTQVWRWGKICSRLISDGVGPDGHANCCMQTRGAEPQDSGCLDNTLKVLSKMKARHDCDYCCSHQKSDNKSKKQRAVQDADMSHQRPTACSKMH